MLPFNCDQNITSKITINGYQDRKINATKVQIETFPSSKAEVGISTSWVLDVIRKFGGKNFLRYES